MRKANFCVGDRVKYVGFHERMRGKFGTIVEMELKDRGYLVEFDDDINGHDGHTRTRYKPRHCWWVENNHIVKVNPKTKTKIVISSDGEKYTTAQKYIDGKLVKTTTAKCHPDDEFDITEGVRVAMEKMDKPDYRIGMRVDCSGYYSFGEGIVTYIDKEGDAFVTPINIDAGYDYLTDFLTNGARLHSNCFCLPWDGEGIKIL